MTDIRHEWQELCGFTEKQELARRTANDPRYKYILYGGARGGAKSYFLRWYGARRCVSLARKYNVSGVRIGLFCENYPELRDRQISKIRLEFPDWLGELKETKDDGLGYFLRPDYGGGILALRNLDDPSKYQSSEFAGVLVDELTKSPVETFNILRGSLRWPGVPWEECKFVGATNPGGIGHGYVRDYWGIQKEQVLPDEMKTLASRFVFVPALPDDNPHLDKAYWDELDTLPYDLAQAWRWGNWSVFAGQVFMEWSTSRHIIEPMTPPAHWKRLQGLDWGHAKPFAWGLGAQDPDTGRIVVYKEVYKAGLTDREQARAIKAVRSESEKQPIHADPSMWTKKTFEDKTFSTADEYRAEGVILTPADNDRLTGKRKIATLIHETVDGTPTGTPMLQVTKNCANLIRTLPNLPRDPVNIEDVDTKAEDHAYDYLRYMLSDVNPRPKRKPPEDLKVNDPILKRLNFGKGDFGSKEL